MEILRDKGKKITIFGYEYSLTISLRTLEKIREKLGPLENLSLNFETIPEILALMVQDYCAKHPEAPQDAGDIEVLKDNLDTEDLRKLQSFVYATLNPGDPESKNA